MTATPSSRRSSRTRAGASSAMAPHRNRADSQRTAVECCRSRGRRARTTPDGRQASTPREHLVGGRPGVDGVRATTPSVARPSARRCTARGLAARGDGRRAPAAPRGPGSCAPAFELAAVGDEVPDGRARRPTAPRRPGAPTRRSRGSAGASRRERGRRVRASPRDPVGSRPSPFRSALLITKMSAISISPALLACTASPQPGLTTTTVVSAFPATSTSTWPTPTVSSSTHFRPTASSRRIASGVASDRPPR